VVDWTRIKKNMIDQMVLIVLLHGFETWSMRKADVARLEAFKMWVWP